MVGSSIANLASPSKGKLQGRRYLSPETVRKNLLPVTTADTQSPEDGEDDVVDDAAETETRTRGQGRHIEAVAAAEEGRAAPCPLPSSSVSPTAMSAMGRTASVGRGMSEKAKGKQRASVGFEDVVDDSEQGADRATRREDAKAVPEAKGRSVTVIFANEGPEGGKVDVWVEEGESVGKVKDQVSAIFCLFRLFLGVAV